VTGFGTLEALDGPQHGLRLCFGNLVKERRTEGAQQKLVDFRAITAILDLHFNRIADGAQLALPEEREPQFIDLCLDRMEYVAVRRRSTRPGSLDGFQSITHASLS
jgi:hypothetical protein